jgi:RimJ/RimL family protein N-acetyltransferase
MFERLVTDRCVLRPFREADVPSLVKHANDREVWLQLRDRFPHPYTLADARHWLERLERSDPLTHFAVEVDGEAAGGIGLEPQVDVHALSAEVGYWLGRAVWGRGVATAAVRALTDFVFERDKWQRLFANVFSTNPASMRVLEKVGYRREGVLRKAVIKDGRVQDQIVYGLTREDWVGR